MSRFGRSNNVNRATVERIRGLAAFARCPRDELARVALALTEHRAPKGSVVAREGDLGQEFFVILEGCAEVVTGQRHVAQLGPGDFFGEVAMLDNQPRTATVVATTDLTVLVSSQPEFAGIVATCPAVTRTLLSGVASRLRETLRAGGEPRVPTPCACNGIWSAGQVPQNQMSCGFQ